MDISNIKATLASQAGMDLKNYLISELEEMKSIESIKEYETTSAQTLEIKAQLRAYKKLKEILLHIIDLSAEAKSKDPRDDYSVY